MERGLVIGWLVQKLSDQRDILRFKRVPPGAEQVQGLAVHKEYRFLRFVDNQLRAGVKVLDRRLPYKSAVIAFILNNLKNISHYYAPLKIYLPMRLLHHNV
jgi:ribosomal protein S18 acetylase RimI-like enzyme